MTLIHNVGGGGGWGRETLSRTWRQLQDKLVTEANQTTLKTQDKQKMVLTKPFCFELLPPSTCVKMAVAEEF